jgi:diguanylate cyclase
MIIKEMFSNVTILVALIFLYTQMTNSSPLNKSSSLARKVLTGFLGGLLSTILMQYSMHFGSTLIDLRHIPLIILCYYGGTIPALISMIVVIIGRFFIGINVSAYFAIAQISLITFISLYISSRKLSKKKKIFSSLTCSNLISSVIYYYLLKDSNILNIIIPIYWGISYLAGFTSFYIVEYLRYSQNLFNQYKSESTIDGLTGLNNVRKFDEVFNRLLSGLETNNEKLSLLYIDIDFFKKINDSYGHTEGDNVLKELGIILRNSTRSFDVVSRNGGEEFSVILLDCPLERAIEIGEGIRKTIENHSFTLSSGDTISTTVSIGIACFTETTKEASGLIEDADKALYEAKRTGRNKVCAANLPCETSTKTG